MSGRGGFAGFMRRNRGLVLAIPAGAFAVLLVVAAFNLDSSGSAARKPSRLDDARDLLAPGVVAGDDFSKAQGGLVEDASVTLAGGAWVQVADEAGRLAQQYSATKLDPLPGNQLAMAEPRSMIYLRDGRVLALAARKGVAFVPRRALESGTLREDVEIRLFKPVDGAAVDVERDAPAVVVTADEAQFDGVLGEVRCDRAVRVATEIGSFAGEGLSLVLDGDGDGLERLVVDRALEPIRIDRAARALEERDRAKSAMKPDGRPDGTPDAKPESSAGGVVALVSPGGSEPVAAPVSAPGTAPAKRPPAETPAPARFYRLVLEGGVEIVRTRGGVQSVIRGDELAAVFSLESRGLDDIAFVPVAPSSAAEAFAHPALAIAIAAHAANGAGGGEDSVVVRYGGRLVMLPTTDPADQLATADDIRFDVVGRRVEVRDGRSGSEIACAKLRYSVRDEFVIAEGSAAQPLVVSNPRLALEGSRFEASLATGVGRLSGAGRIALGRGQKRAALDAIGGFGVAAALAPDAARMLVSADPAAVALVASAAQDAPRAEAFRFDPATQELEISWKGGVDLRFAGNASAKDDGGARLSSARFVDGVEVRGREFELASSALEVTFAPGGGDRIERILADGGARARRLGGEGLLAAERLELSLGVSSKGDAMPRRLVAQRRVEARDERQNVWTDELVVEFRERVPQSIPAEGAAPAPAANPAVVDAKFGELEIDTVLATGGVQVLLREGARVFADVLEGDAARRRLRLTGADVAIVRGNVIADNLRDLRFDDATRSARSEGPGRFRAFRDPIATGDGPVERPAPAGVPTLDASWTGELAFQEISADRGTLDIRGGVKVRSKPGPATSDAVDADSLLLGLGLDPAAKGAAGAADARRTFDQFIAKGAARIESRTWDTPDRAGDPRVFRVAGEHVEYDMRTREGLVVGDGTILVNMPARAEQEARTRTPGSIALGADGTTRFRWKRRMALERQFDDRFLITLDSEVEMLHAGLRPDDTMSLRCDRLESMVRRPEVGKDASPDVRDGDGRGVDLGGPAELLGLRGTGSVFIRTPEQDVECGEFDYSVVTGIATLTGAEGRPVTIAVKGQPTPIRAEQVVWDLRNGRIQVTKAAGSAAR